MVERRKSARSRCLLGARVVFNARSSTMSCTLKNYSEDGALLKFGETPYIPDQLEIVLDNRRSLMPVQVAWRRGDTVGIAFPRGRFMAELKEDTQKNAVASRPHYVDQTVH
jgi:PilZ domain